MLKISKAKRSHQKQTDERLKDAHAEK